jgi:hypothetical protein
MAGAGADRAPQPEEVPLSPLHSTELLAGRLAAQRERRETLRRLGRERRLAAYRSGECELDTCCLWAASYPREVALLTASSSSSRGLCRRCASGERPAR